MYAVISFCINHIGTAATDSSWSSIHRDKPVDGHLNSFLSMRLKEALSYIKVRVSLGEGIQYIVKVGSQFFGKLNIKMGKRG